jgi:hypothetical protein
MEVKCLEDLLRPLPAIAICLNDTESIKGIEGGIEYVRQSQNNCGA